MKSKIALFIVLLTGTAILLPACSDKNSGSGNAGSSATGRPSQSQNISALPEIEYDLDAVLSIYEDLPTTLSDEAIGEQAVQVLRDAASLTAGWHERVLPVTRDGEPIPFFDNLQIASRDGELIALFRKVTDSVEYEVVSVSPTLRQSNMYDVKINVTYPQIQTTLLDVASSYEDVELPLAGSGLAADLARTDFSTLPKVTEPFNYACVVKDDKVYLVWQSPHQEFPYWGDIQFFDKGESDFSIYNDRKGQVIVDEATFVELSDTNKTAVEYTALVLEAARKGDIQSLEALTLTDSLDRELDTLTPDTRFILEQHANDPQLVEKIGALLDEVQIIYRVAYDDDFPSMCSMEIRYVLPDAKGNNKEVVQLIKWHYFATVGQIAGNLTDALGFHALRDIAKSI